LFCDRQETVKSIKVQINKFMIYLKGRIYTDDITTMTLINRACFRSLMVYFLPPLHAAGAITRTELNKLDAENKRSSLGCKAT
jgi:hypothetical protein